MGIFDFIEKSQKKVIEKQEEITNKVNDMARKLSLTQIGNIESSKKITKKSVEKQKTGRSGNKIIETSYADYTENQYISKDKPKENIMEKRNTQKVDRSSDVAKIIMKQRSDMQRQGFTKYEFIANRNRCDICVALDGKHFDLAKLEIGVNAPPMHDGCSCSIAAWEDEDEYNAWLDHIANGGTTARRKNKRK